MSNLRQPAIEISAKAVRRALGMGQPDYITISDVAQAKAARRASKALLAALKQHHPERMNPC